MQYTTLSHHTDHRPVKSYVKGTVTDVPVFNYANTVLLILYQLTAQNPNVIWLTGQSAGFACHYHIITVIIIITIMGRIYQLGMDSVYITLIGYKLKSLAQSLHLSVLTYKQYSAHMQTFINQCHEQIYSPLRWSTGYLYKT